jgi:hypothetical protein
MATPTTTDAPKRLLDDRLLEMMEAIRSADSVELKLTMPDSALRSTLGALGIDPLDAQIRQVFFFDTPDLRLNEAGVVVRARRVAGKGDDSVVKLRPVVASELPPAVRTSPNLVVEVDTMPSGFVTSATLKNKLSVPIVRDTLLNKKPLRKVFSKEQRAFYKANAPEDIALDDLATLGPIFVLKGTFVPENWSRKFVAELWLYPGGERILELSTKCVPDETVQTILDARSFLDGRGIEIAGSQQTKTKTALEFFSQELRGDASA